jgi:hypothetical protein
MKYLPVLKENILLYSLLLLTAIFVYLAFLLGNHLSPDYLWLLIPGGMGAGLSYLEYRRLQRRKLVARLRAHWGTEELKKERDLRAVASLFEQAHKPDTALDDRTWQDLTMDAVFTRLDRTLTWPGMQTLYRLLRLPEIEDLDRLRRRGEAIAGFQREDKVRENVQVILSGMEGRIGSGLCTLLWNTPQIVPRHPLWLYRLMFVLALFSPLLLALSLRYSFVILLIFQINMYLHFKVQKEIKAHFEGVRSLRQLISISKKLSRVDADFLGELTAGVREAMQQVKSFRSLVRHVGVESTDPFTYMFQQYFTIFYLAEVRGFYRALGFIEENRAALQKLFLTVGEIDALQSAASYRASLDYFCEPEFTKGRGLELAEAYHPLLVEPVPNSIKISQRGILITGSNMSGKSTFLRTVGVNVLLGQSIATCPAKVYRGCPLRLMTSIGRADNIIEGRSYYLEEALSVLRIVEKVNEEMTTLVIFDELYRGTNSEERIFAARRVLEYLVRRNALVLTATHDLELTSLLEAEYTSFHFSERVGELGLEFDYKLKEGPATTKNAIALLRHLGYPAEITN